MTNSNTTPTTTRRHGGDSRGSAAARRVRKVKLLNDPRWGGNGETVACVHCGIALTFASLEQDRIVPGSMGGSYRYANIQPSCSPDNKARSDNMNWVSPLMSV